MSLCVDHCFCLHRVAAGINIDEACTVNGEGDCIADALCTMVGTSTVCKCDTGFTAIADKSACSECYLN